ncbi:citrate synthase [Roseibium algae]|uniref:Citrate synthase n=1 Tax=Roseibium algae TaxID=3123038 RepID=A0ABU8TLK5_9HYPH
MTRPLKHNDLHHNLAPAKAAGLEDITAAETTLSDVDGLNGNLVLRGMRIEDLAGKLPFENAVAHLWQELIPLPAPTLRHAFGQARLRAFSAVDSMLAADESLSIFERMRVGLSAMTITGDDLSPPIHVSGALPVLLASAYRIDQRQDPIAPNADLGTAHDMLRMLFDGPPADYKIATLDRYLVTILDHGLNASTFTARVIASTQADMRDSVVGAMSALKGPLHGGAPGPVLDMLDDIGTADNAEAWIETELGKGARLMGFGHRVYRTRDPRADVLKAGLAQLPQDNPKLVLAEAVEQAALKALAKAKPDRPLDTNVEFYTAVLLDAIGIDRRLFTPLFAVGRAPGWCAHVAEQQKYGKLIRPASRYVGP